jgi:hypothetical protein
LRANPLTKPLQGRLFWKHRDWLLNTTVSTQVIESQQCVGARLAREQELIKSKNEFNSDEGEWTIVVSKKVKRSKECTDISLLGTNSPLLMKNSSC